MTRPIHVSLGESWGEHPSAELELIDESDRAGDRARLRVREPHGKCSIFLTRDDLVFLAEQCLLIEAAMKDRIRSG